MQKDSYPTSYARRLPNKYIPPPLFGIVEQDIYRSSVPSDLSLPFLARLHLRTILYLSDSAGYDDEDGLDGMEGNAALKTFIHDNPNIRFIHIPSTPLSANNNVNMNAPNGGGTRGTAWDPVSEETVLSALEILLNTSTTFPSSSSPYPILVMCNHGNHRTGTVVACLRKVQRWSLCAIFEEYRRYTSSSSSSSSSMNANTSSVTSYGNGISAGILGKRGGGGLYEQFVELFDTELVRVPSSDSAPAWL